jgi:hypothetical protein
VIPGAEPVPSTRARAPLAEGHLLRAVGRSRQRPADADGPCEPSPRGRLVGHGNRHRVRPRRPRGGVAELGAAEGRRGRPPRRPKAPRRRGRQGVRDVGSAAEPARGQVAAPASPSGAMIPTLPRPTRPRRPEVVDVAEEKRRLHLDQVPGFSLPCVRPRRAPSAPFGTTVARQTRCRPASGCERSRQWARACRSKDLRGR